MKNALKIAAAALCCVALVACSQKGPAEAALKAAETSVNEVKADGAKYAVEQTKGLLASYSAAQEAFNKGDYKAAMELAQAIPAKGKDVVAAVAAKKDELTKSWNALTASVPGMVEQVKAKVDALSAMKKLPKDMDAAKLDAAKTSLADLTKSWGEAADAFKSGNLIGANAKANAVKTKVADAMAALGLTAAAPAAAPAVAPAPAPAAAAAAPATPAKK
ncbi:MAG: hypothetical protein NEA02_05575 [Thermoanaerobaculia bacterium]|nr:hypothetical protein [Thermoanaerobaculia bacterium]